MQCVTVGKIIRTALKNRTESPRSDCRTLFIRIFVTMNAREAIKCAPAVAILPPLLAGILLADAVRVPFPVVAAAFAAMCSGAYFFKRFRFAYIAAALAATGMMSMDAASRQAVVPHDKPLAAHIRIIDTPVESDGFSTCSARIESWDDGSERGGGAKIKLHAAKPLAPSEGERAECIVRIRPFRESGYGSLMIRRGYAGEAWLHQNDIAEYDTPQKPSLHTAAVRRILRLPMDGDARATVAAMSTGERSLLSKPLRQAYARSGAAHLLAVSGLHTGVVFMLANALLWWLPLLRRGHIARNVAVVMLLWLYVAVCGAPPSAVRAAAMFSVLQFALASTRPYVGINALAATAAAMLVINPQNLFDVGFLLSFTAVAAIIVWAVPIIRLLHTRSRAANALLSLVVIGITASLAVAPITSCVFGSVAAAGCLLNPLVIITAQIIVTVCALWLAAPVTALAPAAAAIASAAANCQNAAVERFAALPWASLDCRLPLWGAVAIYAALIIIAVLFPIKAPEERIELPEP